MKVLLKSIYKNWEKLDLEELESSSFCGWFICSFLSTLWLRFQLLCYSYKNWNCLRKENFKSHQTS